MHLINDNESTIPTRGGLCCTDKAQLSPPPAAAPAAMSFSDAADVFRHADFEGLTDDVCKVEFLRGGRSFSDTANKSERYPDSMRLTYKTCDEVALYVFDLAPRSIADGSTSHVLTGTLAPGGRPPAFAPRKVALKVVEHVEGGTANNEAISDLHKQEEFVFYTLLADEAMAGLSRSFVAGYVVADRLRQHNRGMVQYGVLMNWAPWTLAQFSRAFCESPEGRLSGLARQMSDASVIACFNRVLDALVGVNTACGGHFVYTDVKCENIAVDGFWPGSKYQARRGARVAARRRPPARANHRLCCW